MLIALIVFGIIISPIVLTLIVLAMIGLSQRFGGSEMPPEDRE